MANEKRTAKITVRLEPGLRDMGKYLASKSGASDLSDYLRGLILADVISDGQVVTGIDIPGWLIGKHIDIRKRAAPVEGAEAALSPSRATVLKNQSTIARDMYEQGRNSAAGRPRKRRRPKSA